MKRAVLVLFAALLIGCGGEGTPDPTASPATEPVPSATPTSVPTASPTPTAVPRTAFPGGIYVALPGEPPVLTLLGGDIGPAIEVPAPGFDISPDLAVVPADDSLVVVTPDGGRREVEAEGIVQAARPSLSPDGARVAVQALTPGGALDIYVVDLATGEATRITEADENDESPEWIPGTNRIAYSSFSPTAGINLHVYDLDEGREVAMIPDAGAIHIDISPDGAYALDAGRARVVDLDSGDVVADLHDQIVEGIVALGYELDDRYPGQAERGTLPLDGAFAPDGSGFVFDGAVRRGEDYGVIVFTTDTEGGSIEIVVDLYEVDPARSNNHNFSQFTPAWLP